MTTILIDDEREALPDGRKPDILVRTYDGGIALLNDFQFGARDELYLDHDLGEEDDRRNGHALMTIVEENYHENSLYVLPKRIVCVSSNPQGRLRIEQAVARIYKRD